MVCYNVMHRGEHSVIEREKVAKGKFKFPPKLYLFFSSSVFSLSVSLFFFFLFSPFSAIALGEKWHGNEQYSSLLSLRDYQPLGAAYFFFSFFPFFLYPPLRTDFVFFLFFPRSAVCVFRFCELTLIEDEPFVNEIALVSATLLVRLRKWANSIDTTISVCLFFFFLKKN